MLDYRWVRAAASACLVAGSFAYDDARCTEYALLGYCTALKTSKYMERHCASHCLGARRPKVVAAEEDSACVKWAEEGYCTDEQFAAYMSRSCPLACGLAPSGSDALGERLAEMVSAEEEEDDEMEPTVEEESEDSGTSQGGSVGRSTGRFTGRSDPRDRPAPSSPESEPAECAGWARQGLCERGNHVEYMQLNCARTCASTPAGSAAADPLATPFNCAQWAMSGLCADGSAHAPWMQQHCAAACEAEASREPNAGLPPPADPWMLLLLLGFGLLTVHAVRRTLLLDSEFSKAVKKAIGADADAVGPGKLNRGALLGAKTHRAAERGEGFRVKRSAKKDKRS